MTSDILFSFQIIVHNARQGLHSRYREDVVTEEADYCTKKRKLIYYAIYVYVVLRYDLLSYPHKKRYRNPFLLFFTKQIQIAGANRRTNANQQSYTLLSRNSAFLVLAFLCLYFRLWFSFFLLTFLWWGTFLSLCFIH